jgi:hypothetical protein
MTYFEIKELIKDKNLKSAKDWRNWVLENRYIYPDLPIKPETKYKNEFEGYIIFLNSKKVKRRKYWSFDECVEHLKNFNFTAKEFYEYLKINKTIPIPTRPEKVFSKEFISFGHFLSNKNIKNIKYYKYQECIDFLKDKNLKNVKNFRLNRKMFNWIFIPSNPEKYFKDDFISYNIFLSNNSISNKNKKFLSYIEAKEFLRKFKFKSINEYKCHIKERNICFLPVNPNNFYKNEYISDADYLSNHDIISSISLHNQYDINILKKFVKDNNLETYLEYLIFLRKN